QLKAKVDDVSRRVGNGANVDDALSTELNALTATAENERTVDKVEAERASAKHNADYSWLWNSKVNPYNWFFDTEGRADARNNVWPLEAEVAGDTEQVQRLHAMQDSIDKHTMTVEQRELIENLRVLREEFGFDVGAALAQTCASTGMSRHDAAEAWKE